MTQLSLETVRRVVGTPLTDREATELADWYALFAAAVAAYPEMDLQRVEPPLRSTAGPRRA